LISGVDFVAGAVEKTLPVLEEDGGPNRLPLGVDESLLGGKLNLLGAGVVVGVVDSGTLSPDLGCDGWPKSDDVCVAPEPRLNGFLAWEAWEGAPKPPLKGFSALGVSDSSGLEEAKGDLAGVACDV
jgi:hypothetical protein